LTEKLEWEGRIRNQKERVRMCGNKKKAAGGSKTRQDIFYEEKLT